MTKEQLAFMFNRVICGFYIKKDILVLREKRHRKKIFFIVDMRTDDFIETEYPTMDDLFKATINGETVEQIMADKIELNTDNEWECDGRGNSYLNVHKGGKLFC